MKLLDFYIFAFAIFFYARAQSYSDIVETYVKTCIDRTPSDDQMTVLYRSIKLYGRFEPFNVKSFDARSELKSDPNKANDVLLKTACICTDIQINGYQFIVVPVMINGLAEDALTLCVFHDSTTTFPEVLDIPPFDYNNYMVAQYMNQMPKSVAAPASETSLTGCIDTKGHPTVAIPGQKACYFYSYAKFLKGEFDIKTAQESYAGPFLGSQLPDFHELSLFSESELTAIDFAASFDYVSCSLLKIQSRLTSDELQTGCRYRGFYASASSKIAIVSCCCDGQNDPNCRDVTEAIKEKKIVCLKGSVVSSTGLGVHEYADHCEQSHMGQVGKVSRRCHPGGHGCFHLNELKKAKKDVISSCIGRAEQMIATHEDAFYRYHEALICLTEEAQNTCHVVASGTQRKLLCCCKSKEIKNNVARCVIDSNMLYNTKEYEIMYIGGFIDE